MTDPSSPPEDRPVPPQAVSRSDYSSEAFDERRHKTTAEGGAQSEDARTGRDAAVSSLSPENGAVHCARDVSADSGLPILQGDAMKAVPPPEELGLSINVLDADRLRLWAENIEKYGPHIGQWGSCSWVAKEMRRLASSIEQAVKDIGNLRAVPPPERREAPLDLEALRGKVAGIDALLRNALIVADGETALRLCGAVELVSDALSIIGWSERGAIAEIVKVLGAAGLSPEENP